jgi:trimethylamine--corrinoid protein Co-methyltransferase
VESEKTLSPVQAVIDNEIIGMVKRYLAGFIVDDESIALDEIRKVGISGEFMSSEHTLAHFRGAIFEPRILVRAQRSQKGEGEDMVWKAEKAVEQVLASEQEPILDPEVERELLRIEKRYSELV